MKPALKYLIANADDFGASRGINRAIKELHELGTITSASLMIDMPAAEEAAAMAAAAPALGVGLHVTLTSEDATPLIDFGDRSRCAAELEAQFGRFERALGQPPTHIDSHQNVHRDPRLTPLFVKLALRHGLPLREHSRARYFSSFYGQWNGETHSEQISVDNLLCMLEQ
jgi:chitin disaccharide deacetylase